MGPKGISVGEGVVDADRSSLHSAGGVSFELGADAAQELGADAVKTGPGNSQSIVHQNSSVSETSGPAQGTPSESGEGDVSHSESNLSDFVVVNESDVTDTSKKRLSS